MRWGLVRFAPSRAERWAFGLYVIFAVVWGTRILGRTIGDGAALQVVLLVVHLATGIAIARWWAPLLAVIPVTIAVATGSDLVEKWGFLVYVALGAAALLAAGVGARRVGRRARPSPPRQNPSTELG